MRYSGLLSSTSLVAWDAQKDFDAVIFQTCGQRPLDAITAELVERLPIDVKTMPPDKQRDAAKTWLRERQSLLVLDDVWSAEMRQLEPGPPCSVLHTSRKHTQPGISSRQSEEVEKFTEAEAEELFHTYLDPVFGDNAVLQSRGALLDFADRVEWLPIAVAVGASMLREKSASPLTRAVLKLRLENLTDGAKDVNALFRTAIESRLERERRLLAAGAVCVQEGFWLPLAAEIAELSEDETEDAANQLVHSSLLRVIDRERRRFQLHALLREEVRAVHGEGPLGKLQEHHAAALERLFKDWETRWRECRECLGEIAPAMTFLWQQSEPARASSLAGVGYLSSRRVGEFDVALRIVRQQKSFWINSDSREAKSNLQRAYRAEGDILYLWWRLDEAMDLHKREEAICLELADEDGLQHSYGYQARILWRRKRPAEALALHRKREDICRKLDNKAGLQRSYGDQAVILRDYGQLKAAMALHKKEEKLCLEIKNKRGLQRSYANQALILQAWGRLEEALALLKAQEAICADCGLRSGLGHCYWYWGLTARAQGDLKTEKEKLEQALAIFTELKMPHQRDAVQAELDKMGSQ